MRKPLWTYLACCIAVFMVAMDNLIVTNALPVIRQALHTGLEGLEWTVNAHTLTFAVLLLTGAALGDRYGRRRLMIIGIVVFTAGSAASALAPGIGALIAARAVSAAGMRLAVRCISRALRCSVRSKRSLIRLYRGRSTMKVHAQTVLAAVGVAAAVLAGTATQPARASSPPPSIWGFGNNSYGQLGDGSFTQRNFPVQASGVLSGSGITQVAAGGATSAAVLSNGTAWTWGSNTYGALGNGSTGGSSTMPGQVAGLSGITQVAISLGGADVFALGPGGVVWGWGLNGQGQLGNGTTSPSAIPMRIPGLSGITQIVAGPDYALALRSNGTVLAWGDNVNGQLGDGTTIQRRTPVQVPGLTGIVQVSATGPSFAVRNDGAVFAWGSAAFGALGLGATPNLATPTQIPGLSRITHLVSGNDHVFAQASSGTIYAWGDNDDGQLGDGTTTSRSTPGILSLGGVTTIAAGPGTSAAIRSDGTLLTWGNNSQGELGHGTCCIASNPVPAQVTSLASVSQVAVGTMWMLAVGTQASPPPPTFAVVPNLSDDNRAQASQALQAAGLVLGSVSTVVDDTCNHLGTVIRQNPAAGAHVSLGSAVSITIGGRPSHPCP